jgi:probable F420-dependent oxidoreductase
MTWTISRGGEINVNVRSLPALGLLTVNVGPCAEPNVLTDVVTRAEEAGFESAWSCEHIVLPDPKIERLPMEPDFPMLASLLGLAWAAAATSTIRLGTGILIAPLYSPAILAKELATLDVLSRGRLILGVGVGYLEPEFDAVGVDFKSRGQIADECIHAMRSLWYDAAPSFEGQYVAFSKVDAYPKPIQSQIPITVGGMTTPALRRALRLGNGWFGTFQTPDSLRGIKNVAGELAGKVERPDKLGPLEITVVPKGRLTRDWAESFIELGVDRIVLWPSYNLDSIKRVIDNTPAVLESVRV